MKHRLPIYCSGLLALMGSPASSGAADDLPLQVDLGQVHLKTGVLYEPEKALAAAANASPSREQTPTRPTAGSVTPPPSRLNAMAPRKSPSNKPQALRLEWGEIYLLTEVQYERQGQQVGTPATSLTREQTLVDPAVGVGVSGSLYHPNLVQFQLNTELGLDWKTSSETPGASESNGRFLQRYHGSIDFLSQKPYAVSLFGDKDMTYREFDFFSRVRVDSESYGGRAGYAAGPVPFTISVQHYNEFQNDPIRPQNFTQDTLWLTAQNHRRLYDGQTRMNYNLTRFDRRDDGFSNLGGLTQSLSLFDTENPGWREDPKLASLFNYNRVSQTAQPTEKLLLQENLRLQHTTALESFYDYSFDKTSAGKSEANTHDSRAGVAYQRTPHLSLGGDIHGALTQSASPDSSLDTRSYGVGANAQYSRPLASWVNFTANDGGSWDREDRNASGTVQTIIGEQHLLSDSTVTFMNQPTVNEASIQVWDTTRVTNYVNNLDYKITQVGTLTQIQRLTGGQISDGSLVAVDYTAGLPNSSSFDSLANNASFRLDFWRGLVGFYGHWNLQVYNGGEALLLRRLDDKTVGVDFSWRRFRAGAEYEIVDSNLVPYERKRIFQSAQFHPLSGTDVNLNADQNWTDYHDNNLHQSSYGFIARCQQRLTSHLSTTLEGGVRFERGETFDHDYATCRAGLDWAVGKLSVKLTYEYNDESHLTDTQDRHYIFLRMRRDFR
ncbi:MAG: hypothetical protein WCH99_13150 [Verrucomicrobiota bacterium]